MPVGRRSIPHPVVRRLRVFAPLAADLVHHGYVLAIANLHVVLDYPLLPIPPLERFAEYVGPVAEGAPLGG